MKFHNNKPTKVLKSLVPCISFIPSEARASRPDRLVKGLERLPEEPHDRSGLNRLYVVATANVQIAVRIKIKYLPANEFRCTLFGDKSFLATQNRVLNFKLVFATGSRCEQVVSHKACK